MKKIILVVSILIFMFYFGGCSKSNSGEKFKKSYESLNGVVSKSGKEHRTVHIDKNNPYEEVKPEDIIEKINNKETFYVYFGDKLCPWCRSVIEKSIEIANKHKVKKIYYVSIWNDDGEEILRDKFEYQNGELKKTVEGDKNYYQMLKVFDNYLSDYFVTTEDGNKIDTKEKRIYAPNFIYIEKGVPKKLTTGISSIQKDSREELTEEILKEEEKLFNDFFNN